MEKQLIISIGREFGSGGHEIAERLSNSLKISFYSRNMLDEIAEEKQACKNNLQKYDETPRNVLFSRTVRGNSNSPEEIVANLQFDFLRKKAESGESFVVVGRCSEHILRAYPGLISIFVLGDIEAKTARVQRIRGISSTEARQVMNRHDRKRKAYHNYHCPTKWGDSRSYHLTVNSSKLGVEKTMAFLETYITARKNML